MLALGEPHVCKQNTLLDARPLDKNRVLTQQAPIEENGKHMRGIRNNGGWRTLIAPMPNKVAAVTTHATANRTPGDESGLINGTMTYLRKPQ